MKSCPIPLLVFLHLQREGPSHQDDDDDEEEEEEEEEAVSAVDSQLEDVSPNVKCTCTSCVCIVKIIP